MQTFRKGQIVPRRLCLVHTNLKGAQHFITFGIDAEWDGCTLIPRLPMGPTDCLIRVRFGISAPMKNHTRRKCGFYILPGVEVSGYSDNASGEYHAHVRRTDKSMEKSQ